MYLGKRIEGRQKATAWEKKFQFISLQVESESEFLLWIKDFILLERIIKADESNKHHALFNFKHTFCGNNFNYHL